MILKKEVLEKISKILVIIFLSLTFISILLPDEFVIGIRDLTFRPDPFQMLIRWFNFASFVVLPIAVYYDKNVFKKIAIYFCLPVVIIYSSLFCEMLPYFTSTNGTGIVDIRYLPKWVSSFMHNGIFRGILFFVINGLEILIIGLLIKRDWQVIKFKKSDIMPFIVILFCSIFTILPPYALEGIFNTYTDLIFKAYSPLHFAWIIFLICEGVILTLMFRKRSEEDRMIVVLILALSLLLQYNQLFSSLGELTCKRMPLQLCNLAAYLILVCILTKNRGLFLFNILINVAGGLIALLVMDVENKGILLKANIHYIVEHNNVILVPILCLTLGIFKPLTNKDFKNFVIWFSIYYVAIFVIGTTFNALAKALDSTYFKCNYLFMFDQETAARLVPFAGELFNIKLEIGAVTIYPVIQPLIYLAFFLIGTLSFFIFKNAVKEKIS